jgi:predicted nucleotidyltransferase
MLSPIGGTRDTIVNSLNINPVIDELCTKKNIIALILFGSVARGQSRQFSDIDLCIITRTDIAESERVDILSYGSGKIDVSLFHDLHYQVQDFKGRKNSLLQRLPVPSSHNGSYSQGIP